MKTSVAQTRLSLTDALDHDTYSLKTSDKYVLVSKDGDGEC